MQAVRVRLNLKTHGHDHAKEVAAKPLDAGYDIKQTL